MRLARIRLTNSSVAFAVLIAAGLTLSVALRSQIAKASFDREPNRSAENVRLTMPAPLTPAGATYTWVGGTPVVTTDWTVATNWNPQRLTPAATDNLVFDGSGTPTTTLTK